MEASRNTHAWIDADAAANDGSSSLSLYFSRSLGVSSCRRQIEATSQYHSDHFSTIPFHFFTCISQQYFVVRFIADLLSYQKLCQGFIRPAPFFQVRLFGINK